MKVAFGFKAHSGWAALVVVGKGDHDFEVVDRRRLELVEEAWAKQPYHAAEDSQPEAARNWVQRGIEGARRMAAREMQAAVEREAERGNEVMACAVLVGEPMPDWSTEEILAVHFRMHKAEGVLFQEALVRAATACGLRLEAIRDKALAQRAEATFGVPQRVLLQRVALLGKSVGPPWGKDQKDAALAALVVLQPGSK